MKLIIALMAAATLAGCTSVQTVSQPYRAKGAESMTIIQGKLTGIQAYGASPDLEVFIGPEKVASGQLGSYGRGSIVGAYQGKPVIADCSSNASGWSWTYQIKCLVMVDGEHATTLTLDPFE